MDRELFVLKGKQRFEFLFSSGRRVNGSALSLLLTRAPDDTFRYAICISRKTGKAVLRNRLRRVFRETLRPIQPNIRRGYYVAFFPRRDFDQFSVENRRESLMALLKRSGLLSDQGL